MNASPDSTRDTSGGAPGLPPAPTAAPPPRSRLRARLLLLGLTLAVGFGAAEVGLRAAYRKKRPEHRHAWFEYDPLLGWRHRRSFELAVERGNDFPDLARGFLVRLNAQGLREDHELSPEPRPGVSRIACIGDSFTFGYCVAGEAAFAKRLEVALAPRAETANWGVAGYGLDQSVLQLERDVLPTKPRLVVLSVIDANFRRATRTALPEGEQKPRFELRGDDELELTHASPVPRVEPGESFYRIDAQGSFVLWGLHEAWKNARTHMAADPDAADERWVLGRALIRRAALDCKRAGVGFAVVLLPMQQLIGRDSLERLLPTLEPEGIPLLDLYPPFQEKMSRETTRLFVPGDMHPSEAGHQLIADELGKFLEARKLLPR